MFLPSSFQADNLYSCVLSLLKLEENICLIMTHHSIHQGSLHALLGFYKVICKQEESIDAISESKDTFVIISIGGWKTIV